VADWPDQARLAGLRLSRAWNARRYTITSAYTPLRIRPRALPLSQPAVDRGRYDRFGVASFSHVGGSHFQNEHEFGPYIAKSAGGQASNLSGPHPQRPRSG